MTEILKELGYNKSRTDGSHERWCNGDQNGVTVPFHKELAPGTALSILRDVAEYEETTVADLKNTYKIKL